MNTVINRNQVLGSYGYLVTVNGGALKPQTVTWFSLYRKLRFFYEWTFWAGYGYFQGLYRFSRYKAEKESYGFELRFSRPAGVTA